MDLQNDNNNNSTIYNMQPAQQSLYAQQDQLFEEEQIPSAVVFSEVQHHRVSVLQEKVKKFDIALLVLSLLFLLGTLILLGTSIYGEINIPGLTHGPSKLSNTWYYIVLVVFFCGMFATGILGIVSAVLKQEHQKKRYATAIANLVGLCVLVSVYAAQLIRIVAVLGTANLGVLAIVALVIGGCILVTCFVPCICVACCRLYFLRKLTSADLSSV